MYEQPQPHPPVSTAVAVPAPSAPPPPSTAAATATVSDNKPATSPRGLIDISHLPGMGHNWRPIMAMGLLLFATAFMQAVLASRIREKVGCAHYPLHTLVIYEVLDNMANLVRVASCPAR